MNDSQPHRIRYYYQFARFLAQSALVLYFKGRVFNRHYVPRTGGVMIASNHQSYFDPISATCALYREGNFMARDTLFTNRAFGRLIASVNAFPVKRDAADVGAIKEILRRLKAGKMVLVFPEGTRTTDGSIGKINPNSMALARRAGATIVPTVIDGAYEAWPRSQMLPTRHPIYVTYAQPITPDDIRDGSDEQIAQIVFERMQSGVTELRRLRRRAHPPLHRPARPA